MIAYVESNFVLGIALQQDEHAAALKVLEAARDGRVTLVVPVFALCEPFNTVMNRQRLRKQDFSRLGNQLRDLSRSLAHADLVEALTPAIGIALEVDRKEQDGLDAVAREVAEVAEVIPLTTDVLDAALGFRAQHGMATNDAIIYASVVLDARARGVETPKIFVTTNASDFEGGDVRAQLDECGCQLYFRFESVVELLPA